MSEAPAVSMVPICMCRYLRAKPCAPCLALAKQPGLALIPRDSG